MSPDFPFLPTPPLKTGFTNTEPCFSMRRLISSSLASGPSTSAVGNPANCSSFAPYSMPVTCIGPSPLAGFLRSVGLQSAAQILQEPVALGLIEIGQELRPDADRPEGVLLFDEVGRNIVAHGPE